MKTIALILARWNSKGVPQKNVLMLGSKHLMGYTIEAAVKTRGIDKVYLTSESPDIGQIGEIYGAEFIRRPEELATDWVQSDEVFLFTLRQLQYRGIKPETLVLLQPTNPFRGRKDIERALELYYEKEEEFTIVTGYRAKGYYWGLDHENSYFPVMHDPIFRKGRQEYDDSEWLIRESGAIYVVSAKRFYEHGRYRVPPFHFYIMSEEESLDIDEPADWARAEELLEAGYGK